VALTFEKGAVAGAQLGGALHPWDCRDGGSRGFPSAVTSVL
jgi:hypothetical protein